MSKKSSVNSLRMKIHKMRVTEDKRNFRLSKVGTDYPISSENLEKDTSTISFSKKTGGQFNQYYKLQKDLKKELEDLYFSTESKEIYPINPDAEVIKSSIIKLDSYFESETFYGLDGICTEWSDEGHQYEEFFQTLLQVTDLNTIRSFKVNGLTYKGKLLWSGLQTGGIKEVVPGLRIRRLSRIRYQFINLTNEEMEIEFINMLDDLVLPVVFKKVIKKVCQRQTLRVYDIKFSLGPFEPGKENYLKTKD